MIDDYKYEEAYKHFIVSKEVLELLSLKLMFLGPPRQGKTTTRRRVTKEIIDLMSAKEEEQIHGSTGTVECSNMLVQGMSDATTADKGTNWTIVQNLTEEASLLLHSLRKGLETKFTSETAARPREYIATMAEVIQASSTEQSHLVEKPPQPTLKQSRQKKSSPLSPTHVQLAVEVIASQDYSEIAAIYERVSRQPLFAEIMRHSFKAFLRMEDTGGQPELMDMLPALTTGPGICLLFFSYKFKLDEEYRVFYQRASGETTAPENSEFTLQEMLLRSLASVSCFSSSDHLQPLPGADNSPIIGEILESSKSVVHIMGTHKDQISEEDITTVDSQLQKVIRDTDFYRKDIVQFCSQDKLVVSLQRNNKLVLRAGQHEVWNRRNPSLASELENAMEKHFKKLKILAMWLLFSLCLCMREVRTASL